MKRLLCANKEYPAGTRGTWKNVLFSLFSIVPITSDEILSSGSVRIISFSYLSDKIGKIEE